MLRRRLVSRVFRPIAAGRVRIAGFFGLVACSLLSACVLVRRVIDIDQREWRLFAGRAMGPGWLSFRAGELHFLVAHHFLLLALLHIRA